MSKAKEIFVNGYNYYENYKNELVKLLKILNSCVHFGADLINNNELNKIDIDLLKLDEHLSLISRLIYYDLTIFAFRWNEFFYWNMDIHNCKNDNWFWLGSQLNNLYKHLNYEVNQFYHGWITPIKYANKDEIVELMSKLDDAKNDAKLFIEIIKKVSFIKNKITYKANKDNGRNYLKNVLNFETFDEYIQTADLFFPIYENYLIQVVNLLAKNSNDVVKAINTVNNHFSNDVARTKFIKLSIKKSWFNFYLKINDVAAFLLFVDEKLQKVDFASLEQIAKTKNYLNFETIWKDAMKNKKKLYKKIQFKVLSYKDFFKN